MDTTYVDAPMMHSPVSFARGKEELPRDRKGKMIRGETTFVETWRAMEKLLKSGKARALGVSNFSSGELESLMKGTYVVSCIFQKVIICGFWLIERLHEKVPAAHQIECHPYLQQKAFNEWLRSQAIHVIQFSPLGNMNDFYRESGWSKEISGMVKVIDYPVRRNVGTKYGKSAVQVALVWGINCRRSVIPMATVDWQIRENAEADFELAPEDMEVIGELDARARFNDPSLNYQWQLYSDLVGTEGRRDGKTH